MTVPAPVSEGGTKKPQPFVRELLGRSDYRIIGEIVEPGSRVLDLGCGDGELLQPDVGGHVGQHPALEARHGYFSGGGRRFVSRPRSISSTSGRNGLSRLTSAGGDQAGFTYLPSMWEVPAHCLPALPTPTG